MIAMYHDNLEFSALLAAHYYRTVIINKKALLRKQEGYLNCL